MRTQDIGEQQFENLTLPIKVTPRHGEGLVDLIYRAIAQNVIGDVKFLCKALGAKGILHHAAFAKLPLLQAHHISNVLGTENGPTDVEPLLYGATDLGPPWISFFGRTLSVNHFSCLRRIAPSTLQNEQRYTRAIWGVRPLGFDPKTKERLLWSCPNCERRLSFRFCLGLNNCDYCGADLTAFPQPNVEIQDGAAIDFVTSLIDPTQQRSVVLHENLSPYDDGQIFSLVVALGWSLHLAGVGSAPLRPHNARWIGEDGVPPECLAIAGRAVMEWPRGIHSLPNRFYSHIRNAALTSGVGPSTYSRGIHYREVDPLLASQFAFEWDTGFKRPTSG